MKNRPLLSISILTNGKSKDLWKTIESVHRIQKQLSSEFIIVDTGCEEELRRTLHEQCDKLVTFAWCDDFAKARNAGLEVAEGEWFLFLDDDEWFEEDAPLIEFFEQGESQNYGYANYKVRNYMDLEGKVYSDSWVLRMARRVDTLHFTSRIHEYLAGKEGEGAHLPLIAEHYGYVFTTEQEKMAHFHRNESLLLAMMEEEPDSIRWPMQLIQEYRTVHHYDRMILFGKHYYEWSKTNGQWKCAEVFAVGWLLGELGFEHYENVIGFVNQLLDIKEFSRLAICSIVHYGAKAAYFTGDYNRTIEYAMEYKEGLEYYSKHIDEKNRQEGLPFITETFDEQWKKEVFSLVICAGLRIGDVTYLSKYWNELQWKSGNVYVFEDIADALIHAFQELEFVPVFYKIADAIWKHEGLRNYFLDEMAKKEEHQSISNCIAIFQKVKEAEEIKAQLAEMKKNGLIKQYNIVLEQMRKLLPDDEEISKMYCDSGSSN